MRRLEERRERINRGREILELLVLVQLEADLPHLHPQPAHGLLVALNLLRVQQLRYRLPPHGRIVLLELLVAELLLLPPHLPPLDIPHERGEELATMLHRRRVQLVRMGEVEDP